MALAGIDSTAVPLRQRGLLGLGCIVHCSKNRHCRMLVERQPNVRRLLRYEAGSRLHLRTRLLLPLCAPIVSRVCQGSNILNADIRGGHRFPSKWRKIFSGVELLLVGAIFEF